MYAGRLCALFRVGRTRSKLFAAVASERLHNPLTTNAGNTAVGIPHTATVLTGNIIKF
jgi:hypothetical protein